jgi:hypothetical protein
VTAVLTYELARQFSGSRLGGLLATLLLLALPSFGYFSRMHIGYVMPWLLLAWLAVWCQRWGWAGLCFGLVLISHFGYFVVVAVSLAVLAALFLRPATWRRGLAFGLAAATPILEVEANFYAYMGRPWQWLRGVASAGYIWTGVRQGVVLHSNWLWAPQTIFESNGVVLTGLLGLGVLAPLVFWPSRRKLAFWLALAGSVAAFAGIALLRGSFIARALGALYPLGAIAAAAVMVAAIRQLPEGWPRRFAAWAAVLALAALAIDTGLFVRQFTRSPFPAVGEWIREAAAMDRPVRYNNQWVGLFFAQEYGAEILTGDDGWILADDPGQSVLIFERRSPANLTRAGYTIEAADVNAQIDTRYPALARDADIPRHVEVWWPSGPSASIRPAGDLEPSTFYYSGSGCVSPPGFGNGTLHFYQLVWRKLLARVAP